MLTVQHVWGKHTTLRKPLGSETEMTVALGDGIDFKAADNGHFYATLRNGNTIEFVKVVGRKGDVFTIERGQDGTTAQTFPAGSCVDVEWNPSQLCEFTKQCVTGDSDKIAAGTVCFTCDTCIEYDAGGHIISVNGAKTC